MALSLLHCLALYGLLKNRVWAVTLTICLSSLYVLLTLRRSIVLSASHPRDIYNADVCGATIRMRGARQSR